MRSARVLTLLAPVLLLSAAIGVAEQASALQISASDCNLGFTSAYGVGDAVCVTGDLDIVPPGKIFPEGDVYIVPLGWPNAFADVSGGANHLLGTSGGGAFVDELVWLPQLAAGPYELVVDQYPFGGALGAEDLRSGLAFTVQPVVGLAGFDPTPLQAAVPDAKLSAIEARHSIYWFAMFSGAHDNPAWRLRYTLVDDVIAKLAFGLHCLDTGTPCPSSQSAGVVTSTSVRLHAAMQTLEDAYEVLASSPADPTFDKVVPLDLGPILAQGGPWTPGANQPIVTHVTRITQLLEIQAAAFTALGPTLARAKSANDAASHAWVTRHAKAARAYATLALDAGAELATELDALELHLAGIANLEENQSSRAYTIVVDELVQQGFAPCDTEVLHSYGLTDPQIAAVRSKLGQLTVPPDLSAKALLAALRATSSKLAAPLGDLVTQANQVIAANEGHALETGPVTTLTTSPTGAVGIAQSVTASSTHFDPQVMFTHAWDLDGDGAFDDATGATIDFTPIASGPNLVFVNTLDGFGGGDIAITKTDVIVSNQPPIITALAPASHLPIALVGEQVLFHVEASDADDLAPLQIEWRVDGAVQGTAADFTFTMPDQAIHAVEVRVADSSPASPDAHALYNVRPAMDHGAGGAGGAGATSSTVATSSASSTSSAGGGGSGESGGGCDCNLSEAPSSTGALEDLGALAGVALAASVIGRRRRGSRS